MKKVLIIVGIILAIIAVGVGAYFVGLNLTEKRAVGIVNEAFSAIKSGDEEKIKEYINQEDNANSETEESQDTEIQKSMVKNLDYEIISKDTKLNECTMKIKVSNKNLKTVFGNYMQKALALAFSQAFGGMTEEEMDKQLENYFKEQYESDSTETVSTELTVTVKKENKKWNMVYSEDELINAILPGYKEVIETVSNMGA